jgi:hypothetical protein
VLDRDGYRFDELGWLQFDDLCSSLFGDGAVRWESRMAGRTGVVDDASALPAGLTGLQAPTLVVVAWLRPDDLAGALLGGLVSKGLTDSPATRSVLLLTNTEPLPTIPGLQVPLVQIGPQRLGELVDADPGLRLRMPALLGICDLGGLIAPEVATRSTLDLAAATALARVFVATDAYRQTLEVLTRRRFAVITGPPEMGKTAIARMVALGRMTNDWEAHECIRPEQLWASFDRDRRQVFVADDAFGSTEYRPDAADRWALELPRILRAMDDRHWLIWTSRPAPLRAGLRRLHREHGLERFPQPAEVGVDAAALTVDEKAVILFRHARAQAPSHAGVRLVRTHGWQIVSHPHFTPERIRRFVGGRLLELAATDSSDPGVALAVETEIREPTTAMAASFAALSPQHRTVLVALLDTPPGPVSERDLATAFRRHAETGCPQTPAELVDRLTDHFVRVVPPSSIAWVHPSWRDLVITALADDAAARTTFLERTGLEGALLAISIAGGASGDRSLPLLRSDADWDTASTRIARLARELDAPSAIRLLQALATTVRGQTVRPQIGGPARAEATALATLTLERLQRAWDDQHELLAAAELAEWFALAAWVPEPPRTPRYDRTWIELLPTRPVDIRSRPEVVRFDDWLALAEVIRASEPEALERLGFPHRQHDVLSAFVQVAALADTDAPELITTALARIRRIAPQLAGDAYEATQTLLHADEPWFDVRFESHSPSPPPPSSSDRLRVARVLQDL